MQADTTAYLVLTRRPRRALSVIGVGAERYTAPPVVEEQPDWRDSARCAETDPEAFFPEKGGSTREAKKTCLACLVKVECLEYALDRDERFGIWGGLSERERRKLKRTTVTEAAA